MFHRKNEHVMQNCLKFSINACKFNGNNCWYNHEDSEKNGDKTPKATEQIDTMEDANNKSAEPPVFQDPPVNLAPPSTGKTTSIPPSQGEWLTMVMMEKEINTMMGMMKKANPFMTI